MQLILLNLGNSLMICANILNNTQGQGLREFDNYSKYYSWMQKRKIKSFYTEINANSFRAGAVSLMQSVGIGKLRPNTLMMGFKNDWQTSSVESVLEYYEIINDAFDMKFGICILKLEGGLDYSDLFDVENQVDNEVVSDLDNDSESDIDFDNTLPSEASNEVNIQKQNIETLISSKNKSNWDSIKINNKSSSKLVANKLASKKNSICSSNQPELTEDSLNLPVSFKSTELIKLKNTKINQGVLQNINIFHRKPQEGFVDVWWLFDDGGKHIYLFLQNNR